MKCRLPLGPRARKVAIILMDVDGVLTDGGLSFIEGGSEAKTYDVKDGVGLWIARRAGLRTGIISGRGGASVVRRAEELRLDEIHLKVTDKLQAYQRILKRQKLSDEEACYLGDDLTDLAVLGRAGMPVAVADAHSDVIRRVPFVTRAPGGRGAVREVVDAILKAQGRWREVLGWFDPSLRGGRRPRRDTPLEVRR
ncbi:MAG TPA: HAD hydrolase family protein [Candidatus Polarisedimenticolia bacterium]|jgi:3-deoxy-D-manno-octulosonate 8-phosphate phosphatase (KDO 8-P phosphatase)|nr:HAD hydrolase family protein [Candidatus Polarisedimenticolia bacterium]